MLPQSDVVLCFTIVSLFFGSTPISGPGEIRPASPTNIMGKILGDLNQLKKVSGGTEVTVLKK